MFNIDLLKIFGYTDKMMCQKKGLLFNSEFLENKEHYYNRSQNLQLFYKNKEQTNKLEINECKLKKVLLMKIVLLLFLNMLVNIIQDLIIKKLLK